MNTMKHRVNSRQFINTSSEDGIMEHRLTPLKEQGDLSMIVANVVAG